jgi:hypothetical protein
MIALYPGAFKPPHRGHFEVVKGLLKGNHGGHLYTKDSASSAGSKALAGQPGDVEKITKVVVFAGGGERNGITKGESMAIWKIYAKYLPGIEVRDGEKNPMFAAKDYAAANEGEQFYAVTGLRDESDFKDLKRITTFKNVNNVQGLAIPSAEGAGVRATDLRAAALSSNLDDLRDFFPKELNREELLSILKMLKDNIIAEVMNQKMEDLFEAMFESEEETIVEEVQEKTKPDLKEYIASVLEYMLDQGMKITPLPEVKTRHDESEASNFFGRTAYYDPNSNEIVLYTAGRHQKDIVRSFVHEMIHHMQNLEGRLGQIGTTNTNEDDHLLEIEKEAYLKGNIIFRNWEDSVKNSNKKEVMAEGKYDSIVTYLTNKSIAAIKNALIKKLHHYKEGHFGDPSKEGNLVSMKTTIADLYPILIMTIPDDIDKNFQKDTDLEFDYELKAMFVKGVNRIMRDGGAYKGGFGKDDDWVQPKVELEFVLDPYNFPHDFEEVSAQISDVLRHEIEHLTQTGGNERGKSFDKDSQFGGEFGTEEETKFRNKIAQGVIDNGVKYLTIPSEIDANIQGLYLTAKKQKRPFIDVVDQYLYQFTDQYDEEGNPYLTKQDVEDVKKVWALRLKALGIKQRL